MTRAAAATRVQRLTCAHHVNIIQNFYARRTRVLRALSTCHLIDLPRIVRLVADFLGKEYNDEQIAGLCTHLHIDNFKKNSSVNMDEMKELNMFLPNETFVRKGKTGGWREYFDNEMAQEAERWITDNLKDTDLRFPPAQ
ncbi:unnamed protein product [Parnassius mnemosyne]|uniref:Sulfotransferase domain-containing protein n=1 Tax=Parnassius mnemosyne TaxID=213953 RepID=A0AAV1KG67_9NEOP